MAENQLYEQLVRRYLENKASDEELEVFFSLLREGKIQEELLEALKKEEERLTGTSREEYPLTSGRVRMGGWWKRLAAAAALIGVMASAALWYYKAKTHVKVVAPSGTYYAEDKQPGRNHALLTLASGKVIDLDSNTSPQLVLQSNARLIKNKAGEWVYHSPAGDSTADVYNTISAPRGGQFPFVLEDGTKVWLNAASSLRFPAVFNGKTREVVLDGEAYFDVAPNAKSTFLVHAGKMTVGVLGTSFNINAYSDESTIRTTLINGAVKIDQDKTSALLHPGEQASLASDGTVKTVKDQDIVDAAIAWRNGYFSFDRDDIQTVMRQISRWYNVDVRYDGPITRATFGGDMERDLTLVQVLKVLEKSQVHFQLEGNTLTVLP